MTTEINWNCSVFEMHKISSIVKRAKALGLCGKANYSNSTCSMDITACHLNGSPIDLDKLINFPDFDFTHDICGIARHINRDIGKLEGWFSPRSHAAQIEEVSAQ